MNTQDTTLPPLPDPDLGMPWRVNAWSNGEAHSSGFTYEQMEAYARAAIAAQAPQPLESIEQYRLQMAGISTAAIGYWKVGDGIHPDYDTLALRDVAKLYAKYDALYKVLQAQGVPAGRTNSGDETGGTVKRFGWDCSGSSPEIIPATNGAFVWYSDYLKLFNQLAAAPQAEPQPEREPIPAMTWDQFKAASRVEFSEYGEDDTMDTATPDEIETAVRIVRLVERHHGIGTKGGGAK